MRKLIFVRNVIVVVLGFLSSVVFAQGDDMAVVQHLFLGQEGQTFNGTGLSNPHPDAQWFPKAGLGLFVHMGLSAVHGGIDLSWGMYANKPWNDGELAPAEYWKLADVWNPCKFNPRKWVKKAAEAGFKYIVFTAKHHDGYTMWPSRYGGLGVKQKLGGRDLVKEYIDACHENGIKVGLYFSPVDWFFDREYINWDRSEKQVYDIHYQVLSQLPNKPKEHDEKRREMVANQVRELLTNYGRIDLIFFDGGDQEISNDEVRALQPGIIINNRNGATGDYRDSEGVLPTERFVGWFEMNDTCWPSRWWGYSTCDRMDSADEVIENLVLLRAWGGNYLANVGPMADGAIPLEAYQAWKGLKKWLKHSGESIYDVQGGPYPEKANQPVTLKGDTVMYIHALPNFQKTLMVKGLNCPPKKAELLRTGEHVQFNFENHLLKIKIAPSQRTRSVDTVKLMW